MSNEKDIKALLNQTIIIENVKAINGIADGKAGLKKKCKHFF